MNSASQNTNSQTKEQAVTYVYTVQSRVKGTTWIVHFKARQGCRVLTSEFLAGCVYKSYCCFVLTQVALRSWKTLLCYLETCGSETPGCVVFKHLIVCS